MSLVPPLKPRQFARIISGNFSPRPKSAMACAVLWAESGYQTWPAWGLIDSLESGFAGSAGTTASTVLVSTEMTPKGMPPSLALPATTVLPQPASVSVNEPLSNKPVPSALSRQFSHVVRRAVRRRPGRHRPVDGIRRREHARLQVVGRRGDVGQPSDDGLAACA